MIIVYNVVMILCLLFSLYFGLTALFTFKKRKAKIRVKTILNLSTGTTLETSPICKAL